MIIDITKDIKVGEVDGTILPILKCKCGETFDHYSFCIGDESDKPTQCPNCKRRLFFTSEIKIFDVLDGVYFD